MLMKVYDFSKHQRVLDLGGGTGSFLAAILAANAQCQGTVFELPHIAEIARAQLLESPIGARASVVEGDFFFDEIPEGHDVTLLANVCHTLSEAHNVELLRRLRATTKAGSRVLIVDFRTDVEGPSGLFSALMSGEFLVITGEGRAYQAAEARKVARPRVARRGLRPVVAVLRG